MFNIYAYKTPHVLCYTLNCMTKNSLHLKTEYKETLVARKVSFSAVKRVIKQVGAAGRFNHKLGELQPF